MVSFGYHPANLKLQPFPHWKVRILAEIAWLLRVQFHLNGIPFGCTVEKFYGDDSGEEA